MKLLGIDYGTRRIGIAMSDERSTLAFPKEIIANDPEAISKIGKVIKEEDISEIVMGESTDFSGNANKVSEKINIFISELEQKFKLPVHKQKEFLTSVEARKSIEGKKSFHISGAHSKIKKEKGKKVDAGAAALILQRYLDRKNKN